MFNDKSVRTKILSILGFAVTNVAAVGIISNLYLSRVLNAYGHLAETNMPALFEINEARNAQRDIVILVSNIASSDHAVKDIDKTKTDYASAISHYEKATANYHAISEQQDEAVVREEVDKGWAEFLTASKKIVDLAASEAPANIEIRSQLSKTELAEARKSFRDSFGKLTELHDAEAKKWASQAKDTAATAKTVLFWATLAGSLLVLVTGFQMAKSLVDKLAMITDKIANASEIALQATQEVSAASEQLTSSSSQQASSIQETATAMEQISAMVSKNAASAESTRDISVDSQQKVTDGQRVVLNMVAAIENISESNLEIASQIERSNQEMSEITKVIAEIETKTNVINDIVFQTKLLSFNASVEAARAGEYGKGFAVVAEEVGNLAQMSGAASKSISEILRDGTNRVKEIIEKTSKQVGDLMADNKTKVAEGVKTVEQCRKVLDDLVENVTRVTEMASGIADASREQSQGVREVNSAVSKFGNLIDETNASSHNLSGASRSLLGQTATMNNVVEELHIVISGKSKSPQATRADSPAA